MRDFLHFIKWMVIIGCSLYLAFVALVAAFFYFAYSPTTRLGQYEAIIGKLKKNEASKNLSDRDFEHLPARIPASATDAKFYYSPGFLSGLKVKLLLTLPSSEISDIEQRLRAKHTALSVEKAPGFSTIIPEPWRARRWNAYASDSQEHHFGDDFIFFDFSPPLTPNNRSRNNFHYKGIAVSQSKHQVLYWVD